jgi:hypothetical protein
MNAIAERQPAAAPALSKEPISILEIVQRAASDPATDVEKLERLMAMAERFQEREAQTAYFAALARLQDELPEIQERGEIKIGNGPGQKYALWEDINKAIKPILKAHGFALSFRTGTADSKITVTGILSHEAGHKEETTIHLPADASGSKNAVQAVGSSTSYGKRYTASALLNITTRGGDDDGLSAVGNAPITSEQLEEITSMLAQCNGDPEKFAKVLKVDHLGAIRQKDMGAVRERLNFAISEYQRNRKKG